MRQDPKTFRDALDRWEVAAMHLAEVAEAYRVAHAKEFRAPEKATDNARKAIADSATSALRLARDKAEIQERAAYHAMIFARGSAGEREAA